MKKSEGLGDTIAKITEATGIDKVAKAVLGEDCGCEERKSRLNKMFPYARVFTDDEKKTYESVLPSIKKGNITQDQHRALLKIYNKVFKANKEVSRCTSCVQQTLMKLDKIYKSSCE
tara:strand:+ start:14267 stop:14617 length:351 start_codon:yes stop_codon:yes gene_type:complete